MNLVSALSHAMELFIVFQFFNDLFSTKGKKIVATAVGFGFYAVAYATFLFVNSTVVNILLCFVGQCFSLRKNRLRAFWR